MPALEDHVDCLEFAYEPLPTRVLEVRREPFLELRVRRRLPSLGCEHVFEIIVALQMGAEITALPGMAAAHSQVRPVSVQLGQHHGQALRAAEAGVAALAG